MKKIQFKKYRFFRRIFAFPFVFAIILITHIFFVFKRTWHFLLYGGEWINFEQPERKNINDIYDMLKEIKEQQSKTE